MQVKLFMYRLNQMIKKDNLNSSLKHVYNLLTIYPMMKYGDSCKQTTDYIILASKYTIF